MNARIYKKQAKRAVELLRSHGVTHDYYPGEGGCLERPRCSYRYGPGAKLKRLNWDSIQGIPERYFVDFDEGDVRDARQDWDNHMWAAYMKQGEDDDFGTRLVWMKGGRQRNKKRHGVHEIAAGWRWRGGRAVRVNGGQR